MQPDGFKGSYCTYRGNTPFTCAVENKNSGIVEIFMKHGADLNAPDGADKTPLMRAIHREDVLKMLLEAKADPNQISSTGRTPLMEASEEGRTGSMSHLIAACALVNTQTLCHGDTALHLAIHSLEAIKVLLNAGANPLLKNFAGQTAYDFLVLRCKPYCTKTHAPEIIPLLVEKMQAASFSASDIHTSKISYR